MKPERGVRHEIRHGSMKIGSLYPNPPLVIGSVGLATSQFYSSIDFLTNRISFRSRRLPF